MGYTRGGTSLDVEVDNDGNVGVHGPVTTEWVEPTPTDRKRRGHGVLLRQGGREKFVGKGGIKVVDYDVTERAGSLDLLELSEESKGSGITLSINWIDDPAIV